MNRNTIHLFLKRIWLVQEFEKCDYAGPASFATFCKENIQSEAHFLTGSCVWGLCPFREGKGNKHNVRIGGSENSHKAREVLRESRKLQFRLQLCLTESLEHITLMKQVPMERDIWNYWIIISFQCYKNYHEHVFPTLQSSTALHMCSSNMLDAECPNSWIVGRGYNKLASFLSRSYAKGHFCGEMLKKKYNESAVLT